MASKNPSSRRRSTRTTRRTSDSAFPDRIFALASPRSVGGVSMFEPGVLAEAETVGNFVSDPDLVTRAMHLLADAGFEVLHANELMINIAGTKEQYESVFGTTLVAEERITIKQQGIKEKATFFDSTDTEVQGLISTSWNTLRGRPRRRRHRGAGLPGHAGACSRRRSATVTSTCRPTCPSAATPTRRTRRASRAAACASRWSTPAGSRIRSSSSGATASIRSCSGPARPTRTSTRTGTEPGSRRTSSPPRRTAPPTGQGSDRVRCARERHGGLQRRRRASTPTSSRTAGPRTSSSVR